MINEAELASLRGEDARAFTSSAVVYRRTIVADTSGGQTITFVEGPTYPCSFALAQVTPREVETTFRTVTLVLWIFIFPVTADVRPTDQLHVGARRFEVVGGGAGSMSITQSFTCQEIT